MSEGLLKTIRCLRCQIVYTHQDKNKFYLWGGNYPSFKMESGDNYDICLSCVGKSSNLQNEIKAVIDMNKSSKKFTRDLLKGRYNY
ncbi:hypothetical protein OAR04_04480 [Flavobacteriales bacterium]|nr:hypothetical protein [Flavobacteriales bacterium]